MWSTNNDTAQRLLSEEKFYSTITGSPFFLVAQYKIPTLTIWFFDRNNHKSNHAGTLTQSGTTPGYLETTRNPFGLIRWPTKWPPYSL
ncbi:hypothetical protein ID853_09035 [Xenorhabdus sp. Vera]|nr:hypothetical protein [Xenorhabdus sp. Vera]